MLTARTPEAHAAVLAQFRKLRAGFFTPPSLEGTIMFPGVDGGAEWGGAAFDPETALLYVNSNEMPWIVRLIPNNDTSLYNSKCATCHREDRTGHRRRRRRWSTSAIAQDARARSPTSIRQGTGRMPGFPDMGAQQHQRPRRVPDHRRRQGTDPKLTERPELG